MWLSEYEDDITHYKNHSFDIESVYEFNWCLSGDLRIPPDKMIWERGVQVKEITVEDIAKKFGIPLEALKIKGTV